MTDLTTRLDEAVPVPDHLGEAGAAFYADVVDSFELSLPEEAALLQAAETMDLIAALSASVRESGVLDGGKPSDVVKEIRQQRAILVRLLGVLDLPVDVGDEARAASASATSRSARAAARARWSRVHSGRA